MWALNAELPNKQQRQPRSTWNPTKQKKYQIVEAFTKGANTIDEILTGPAEQAKILMENPNTLILGADASRLEA